jgi:septum site-determining protein MinD
MSELLVRAVPHGDPALRRLRRLGRHLLGGTAPARTGTDLAGALAVPLTTGRRIAVGSVRGGAGRTTCTALLAAVFAARRPDPVLVVDAGPAHGSLLWRLGLDGAPPLDQLAPGLLAAADLPAACASLVRAAAGPWVAPPGSAAAVREVTRALSRFFPITVLDTGPDPAVFAEAHAVVLVTPATADGVRSTAEALHAVPPAGRERFVVALVTASREGRRALRAGAARRVLEPFAVPVVALPYDRHLAGAVPLRPDRIGEDTLDATARLAAAVVARARPLW